jgi:hypothetical protein
LRLGDANPKGSPGTVDIDSIPDKLYDTQVDTSVVVGEGAFKGLICMSPFLPVISAVFNAGMLS